MDAAHDPLYSLHSRQAKRLGRDPLPYPEFQSRLPECRESDLSGLLLPRVQPQAPAPKPCGPKFNPGQVCLTANAARVIPPDEVMAALHRHVAGDWGELDAHDVNENERALKCRGRLLSAYQSRSGERFWIITDAGWEITTVPLPEDY